MQQIAQQDVEIKLNQFNDVSKIAEKLNSSISYQSAFDEALKAEALRLAENGEMIELDDFIQKTKNFIQCYSISAQKEIIEISDPIEEANNDLAIFLKSIDTDFAITQKMERSDNYAHAFENLLPPENKEKTLNIINAHTNHIHNIEDLTETFNETQGNTFPEFIIDPIARNDLASLSELEIGEPQQYKLFEISQKIQKSYYAKSIKDLFNEKGRSLGLPDTYGEYKFNSFNDVLAENIKTLNDEQKEEFTDRFKIQFPSGFKTTRDQDEERREAEKIKSLELKKEIKEKTDEFNKQVYDYLKSEKGNETARIEHTQYLQEMMILDSEKFNQLSQAFFEKTDLSKVLPQESIEKLIKSEFIDSETYKAKSLGAKRLTDNLKAKVASSTKELAKIVLQGEQAIKSKEHLKAFYADKFSKEYVKAEEKIKAEANSGKK